MTYRDILLMRKNLDEVNPAGDVDPRFLYAVSKNKAKLDSIIKILEGMKKPTEEIEEFWRKLDEINKKYAEVDESGTVLYTNVQIDDQMKKAYKKIVGEGNPESKYTKEVEQLKREYQELIDKYEQQIKGYNKLLDEEVPEGDYRKFMIDIDIVPKILNPKGSGRAMDGCMPFIKEIEQEEEPAEKESKLKKT